MDPLINRLFQNENYWNIYSYMSLFYNLYLVNCNYNMIYDKFVLKASIESVKGQ